MRRLLLGVVVSVVVLCTVPGIALAQPRYEFKLGFKAIADQIPDIVGDPIEDEWHNPLTGDTIQRTAHPTIKYSSGFPRQGMMVWRKSDNWTAFTDGSTTWVNGPYGLQARSNAERFPWENDPIRPGYLHPKPSETAPAPQPVAPVDPCVSWFSQRVDFKPGSTLTYQWKASRGQRLLINVAVWGATRDVAVRLWSEGGTSLADVQIDGTGTAELVAPFDGNLHWDIRNSIWNATETVEFSVRLCTR